MALLMAVAAALAFCGSVSAATWPIEIVERPAGKSIRRVVLVAEKPGGKATGLVFARATGQQPLRGVAILMSPISRRGMAVGLGEAEIRADGRAVPESGITISSRPRFTALTISLTAPEAPGVYRGRVYGLHRGQARFLFTLALKVEPLLELMGVGDDGIKLERRAARVAQTLRVRSHGIRGFVRFEVGPLTSPNSTEEKLDLTIDGKRIPSDGVWFSPGQTKVLALTADAPLAGTYASSLTISRRGVRDVIPVTIARTRERPTIEVLNIGAIQRTSDSLRWESGPWPGAPWEDSHVSFTAVLHETAGDVFSTSVSVPQLVRTEGQSESNEDLAAVRVVAPDGKEGPYEVSNDGQVDVRVSLGTLGPGTYNGILRAQVAGAPAVDTPFVLSVRRSQGLAALLIAVGMLATLFVRSWRGEGRQTFKRKAMMTELRRDMVDARGHSMDASERTLIASLLASYDNLAYGVSARTVTNPEAELARLRRRFDLFRLWRNAHRSMGDLPRTTLRAERRELNAIARQLGDDKNLRRNKRADLDGLATDLAIIEQKVHAHALREAASRVEGSRRNSIEDKAEASLQAVLVGDRAAASNMAKHAAEVLKEADVEPPALPRTLQPPKGHFKRFTDWLMPSSRVALGWLLDFASWFTLFVIAVVVGVKVLWHGDPTWGDFGDCVAAFLWGAGVQQVGGVTYQGLISRAEGVDAPRPEAAA
jgi:hypothetical protein